MTHCFDTITSISFVGVHEPLSGPYGFSRNKNPSKTPPESIPVRCWKLIHQRILVLIHLLFIHRTCHRLLVKQEFSGCDGNSSPKMWTKTWKKHATKAKQKANWIIKPEDRCPKTSSLQTVASQNCCNRPQIYFHVKNHCHPKSWDTLLYASQHTWTINPLHTGFTYFFSLHTLLQTMPPFNTCGIHLLILYKPNSPWGSSCHVAKWHWPSFADSLCSAIVGILRGKRCDRQWFHSVFSHGLDLYTDFVDVYDCSLHWPPCHLLLHAENQKKPVEVVNPGGLDIGHRG